MIFFKAQRLQELARQLLELQRRLESGSGDASLVREGLEEVALRVGVDLDAIRLATPDTVAEVLNPGGAGDPGKRWAVAETLFLDGLRALAEGTSADAAASLEKARRLFGELPSDLALPEGTTPPTERIQRIDEILEAT